MPAAFLAKFVWKALHSRRHRRSLGDQAASRHAVDPLDRTASRTEKAGTPAAKTTDFAYLGLTGQLLDERVAGSRIYFIRPILNVGGQRGREVVESLRSDPTFGKEARALLKS